MSYEGYAQQICENGHLYERDVYDSEESCPHCQGKSVFYNGVDETNCEQYGIIPPDQWEKLRLTEEKTETCNLGHVHVIARPTYRVPTDLLERHEAQVSPTRGVVTFLQDRIGAQDAPGTFRYHHELLPPRRGRLRSSL